MNGTLIKHRLSTQLTVLILLFVLTNCKDVDNKESTASQQPRELPVIQVMAKDTVLHRQYVAEIMAIQNVELRARVPGFLEEIYVDEGMEVSKGQILFKTND